MYRSSRMLTALLFGLAAIPAFAGDTPLSQPAPEPAAWLQAAFAKPIATPAAAPTKCVKPKLLTDAQGRIKVGTEVALTAQSTAYGATKAGMNLAWRQEINHPGATYIAPHFKRFNLPAGAAVVVRSPDSSRLRTYTGQGKRRFPDREGFWGMHIPGEKAVVEVWSRNPVGKGAVQLDGYARGYSAAEMGGQPNLGQPESLCGPDDSRNAQCYTGDIYNKGKAVARLLIGGTSACTGWLVGSEGHLITNNHCISTSSSAGNTDYEFMAEGSCATNCKSWGACPGTVAADTGTLVQTDAPLDYTLIKLPTNVSTTYGYLQMRTSAPVVDERIYIPGHPAAWGKHIAVVSTAATDPSGFCEVNSLNESPCSGGPGDIGYTCDTQGGSSGSPVLANADHAVVSLHHCGGCNNTGVPVTAVISDLGSNLPANATTGGGGGNAPPTANFTFSTSGLTAAFTDSSTDSDGSIASRNWSFGDGGTSTATNPSHTYASSGTYNVILTVTDNLGATGSVTKTVTVSGTCGIPGTSCTANSQCCSNSCKGKPGRKTCR